VIADIGTVAIIAHRTVKQADTATGGQLTTVVQQAAGVIGNAARNTIETEQSAKDKRKHAKGGLLSAAIQNQTHSDAQAKLDDAQPAQEEKPDLSTPKQKRTITAEQAAKESSIATPSPAPIEASGKSKKRKQGYRHRRNPYRRR
jgi:Ser-tRNA(Ala) deacylase AlaX